MAKETIYCKITYFRKVNLNQCNLKFGIKKILKNPDKIKSYKLLD